MITVVAKIEAKTGKEKELRQELLKLVPITQKEDGCINYDLHVSQDRPGEFVFHENWRDAASLEKHLRAPHVANLMKQGDMLLAHAPEIKWYSRIS